MANRPAIFSPNQNLSVPVGIPRKFRQPPAATADYNVPNRDTVERPEVVTTFDPEIGMGCATIDLSVAHSEDSPLIIPVSGNYIWLSYSTNLTDVISLKIGSRNSYVRVQSGQSVVGVKFDKLLVSNDAIAGAEMDIAFGLDPRVNFIKFG